MSRVTKYTSVYLDSYLRSCVLHLVSKSTDLNNNNTCFIDYVKVIETGCSRRINSVMTDVVSIGLDAMPLFRLDDLLIKLI